MSDRVLYKKGSTGAQTIHVPTFVRTNSALVQAELQGASGTTIKVRLEGRVSESAPWAQLGDVIVGRWMTAGAGEVKANSQDSFAVQLAAAPQMRANVTTLTGAVAASAANSVAFIGDFTPGHGDTVTIDDGFGNTITIHAVGIGQRPEPNWYLNYQVQDAGPDNGINAASLKAVVNQAVADRKILVDLATGSQPTRLDSVHLVPGTTGNSATFTVTGTKMASAGNPSGGTGADTYATVDINTNW